MDQTMATLRRPEPVGNALRGISTASVMQTASLAGCPNLLNNFSPRRYSVLGQGTSLIEVVNG